MTQLSTIVIAGARRLSLGQELELHRAAMTRNPSSPLIRGRLANLLVQSGLFEEAVALLHGKPDLSFAERIAFVQALLARRTAAANEDACRVAQAAAGPDGSNAERAALLALQGKAQARLGDAAARATFELALDLDPANKDACKRLAAWLLSRGDPQAVLDVTRRSGARGAAHPSHFAAQVMALAMLGQFGAAHDVDGRAQLGTARQLPPPPGWDSIADFNAALAAQLSAHPGLQYERDGTASEKTWRIDTLNTPDAPLVAVLLAQIGQQIDRHVAGLHDLGHPWLASLPEHGTMWASCLIAEGEGYETWHMHEHGSLSGVYYVAVPDAMAASTDSAGCIAFGLPPDTVGDQAAAGFGVETVRPAPGDLLIFPSHSFHRTYPHGGPDRRICIAFDIWPH